jgi:hypothetical protein
MPDPKRPPTGWETMPPPTDMRDKWGRPAPTDMRGQWGRPSQNRPTATGPNGEKVELVNGEWVPMAAPEVPKPRALPGMPTAAGAAMDREIREGLKSGAGELVANVLGLPHALGEVLALGNAAVSTAAGVGTAALRGEPLNVAETWKASRRMAETPSAVNPLMAMPEPNSGDVLGMVGLEEKGSDLATSAGKTAADVATLVALNPASRIKNILKARKGPTAAVDPDTRGMLDKAARSLTAGLGKTAEAGFEGAVVGALGDGDPANTAAWSAGIQAGGSMALTAKAAFLKHPFQTFGSLWLGHEMFKAVAPGPQDLFDSKDAAVQEMVGAYGLGIAASLVGAGRGTESQRVVNAISRASRAGIASVVGQLQAAKERGEPQYELVVSTMVNDPDHFGPEYARRLQRAADSKKENELTNEIDRLMRSNRFKKLYDAIPTHRTGGGF